MNSDTECARCDGYPANSTNAANAMHCTCSVGFFMNSAVNLATLRRAWSKSNVQDHPLSADYRDTLSLYLDTYKAELSSDMTSSRSKTSYLYCLPCPPNLMCLGNMNPPISASVHFSNRNTTSLFYGVLPIGAGSAQWWRKCPTIRDGEPTLSSNRQSVGLSSCFRSSNIWSSQNTLVPPLSFTSFPALLLINASNTSLITAIVNGDQDAYLNRMHATWRKTPSMKFLTNSVLGDAIWLVSVEMHNVHVFKRYSEILAQKQDEIVSMLTDIDQSTGVAFSVLIPLLWACAVRQHTPLEMAEPIFIVPGVVHSVITQRIAVRTITAVMQIFDVAGPIPRHIFQLSSRQMSGATSSQSAYANPLFYIHNNLCDSYYNPDETYATCSTPFSGTLLSSYTSNEIRQIKLSPRENSILINSNVLQHVLHIDHATLLPSNAFMCPKNMRTERVFENRITVSESIRCRICTDQQFWKANKCHECDIALDACEQYSQDMRSWPCSWTNDLQCEIDTEIAT